MAQPDDSQNQQMLPAELEDSLVDVQGNATVTDPSKQSVDTDEFWRTVELCSWASLAFLPVLYFVNGPAVSTDQFVIRCLLVAIVLAGVVISVTRRLSG